MLKRLAQLRGRLEPAFSRDTAYEGTVSDIASAGHCAVVAAIVAVSCGGDLLQTHVNGVWHWLNRMVDGDTKWDVDLTGDQFGLPQIQVRPAGSIYPNVDVAGLKDLNTQTIGRAITLALRAGLKDAANALQELPQSASQVTMSRIITSAEKIE